MNIVRLLSNQRASSTILKYKPLSWTLSIGNETFRGEAVAGEDDDVPRKETGRKLSGMMKVNRDLLEVRITASMGGLFGFWMRFVFHQLPYLLGNCNRPWISFRL